MDQFVQYHLDNHASVAEVLASDSRVRIRYPGGDYSKIHFMVTDTSGACAVIDYIGGTRVVHTGDSLPYKALSNSPYDQSLAYVRAGVPPVTGDNSSDARFYRAAAGVTLLRDSTNQPVALNALAILAYASQGSTLYSVIYDLKFLSVGFRTHLNSNVRAPGCRSALTMASSSRRASIFARRC
jgi:penicillin V acylase-like amidase (Ntn superfamily)